MKTIFVADNDDDAAAGNDWMRDDPTLTLVFAIFTTRGEPGEI
jgi:hypothetical protein